jgi:hypothetical protein
VHAERRCVWVGEHATVKSRGDVVRLLIEGRNRAIVVTLPPSQATWLGDLLTAAVPKRDRYTAYPSWHAAKRGFPGTVHEFSSFTNDPSWNRIRRAGLLLV